MHLREKFVGLVELAETLGVAELTLKRSWLKRHLEKGMPRKCPAGWIWPRRAMELWLSGAVLPANDNAAEPDAAIVDPVASQNAALRARYGGRA